MHMKRYQPAIPKCHIGVWALGENELTHVTWFSRISLFEWNKHIRQHYEATYTILWVYSPVTHAVDAQAVRRQPVVAISSQIEEWKVRLAWRPLTHTVSQLEYYTNHLKRCSPYSNFILMVVIFTVKCDQIHWLLLEDIDFFFIYSSNVNIIRSLWLTNYKNNES